MIDLESLKLIIEEYINNKSLLEAELLDSSKKLLDVTDIRIKLL